MLRGDGLQSLHPPPADHHLGGARTGKAQRKVRPRARPATRHQNPPPLHAHARITSTAFCANRRA